MPGRIDGVAGGAVRGTAWHPVHPTYIMTVHAIAFGRVVRTVLADLPGPDGAGGFALSVDTAIDAGRVRVVLGETGEVLAPIARPPAPALRLRRVEDLLQGGQARTWITGACHLDATAAGLRTETVIDLLCRDYIGHPAGPAIMAAALARWREGGFDAVRRMLIESGDYAHRRMYEDAAPGAIFSQKLILAVAAADFVTDAQSSAQVIEVAAAPLLALEGAAFLTACYRQILRKEIDRGGMSHYLALLEGGTAKAEIIRHLSSEFEALRAGIVVTGLGLDG